MGMIEIRMEFAVDQQILRNARPKIGHFGAD
jgi:hypothetical protein